MSAARAAAKILVVLAAFACAASAQRALAASGVARVALVVGANRGLSPDLDLRFAESDAARFAAVLRELGRHRRADVRLLRGPSPAALLGALRRAASRVRGLRRLGREVIFTFYYSGHAGPSELRMGGRALPLSELRRHLRRIPAEVRLSIVDACHSGAFSVLARKGGRPAPAFRIRLVDELAAKGDVFIASSARDEAAQESASLQGSFFTSHLVSGLRGAADRDGDARVTLAEAYDYAYAQTLRSTALSHAGLQHPGFRYDVRGRRDLVLSWPGGADSHLSMRATTSGPFLVFSAGAEVLYAEVPTTAGEERRVGLPPGRYLVQKRTASGLLGASVSLGRGERARVDESMMARAAYEAGIAFRGGDPEKLVAGTSTLGGLGVELRFSPVYAPGFGGGYLDTARAFQFDVGGEGGFELGAAFDRWRFAELSLSYARRSTRATRHLDAFEVTAQAAVLDVRATVLAWPRFRLQVGAGALLHFAATTLTPSAGAASAARATTGGVRGGLLLTAYPWPGVGVSVGYHYVHVPAVLRDGLGRSLEVGGHQLTLFALSVRL